MLKLTLVRKPDVVYFLALAVLRHFVAAARSALSLHLAAAAAVAVSE